MRPPSAEYAPYFERYIALVPGDKVIAILLAQPAELRERLGGLSDQEAAFRYAPGKWSVREVLGHLIDTERIFGIRALWFARGDAQPFPGFEQDDFAATAGHDRVPIDELLKEFEALRRSHVLMLDHLPPEAWARVGTSNGKPMSARAAAFIMAGHVSYHLELLRQRYNI